MTQCSTIPSIESSTGKHFNLGTFRDRAPELTIARVMRHAPALGITRVANLTGLDVLDIPVVGVIRPNSQSQSVSQGKGVSLEAAKASGMMESFEGYCAENDILIRHFTTTSELNTLEGLKFAINFPRKTNSEFQDSSKIHWVEARDLVSRQAFLVPYEIVHCRYTIPRPVDYGFFSATSNGLASGNNWHEAVLHGLCEVIERDAYTLWGESNIFPWCRERTRLDLSTVNDQLCYELLEKCEKAGFDIAIWNMTSDIGVATFRCEIAPPENSFIHPLIGSGTGCHPDRSIALSRAITEAAQHRLTVISGARDNLPARAYTDSGSSSETRKRQIIQTEPTRIDFQTIGSQSGDTIEIDLNWVIECLTTAGFQQALIVNLTLPEFGIPVVRALIPGLEDSIGITDYAKGPRASAAGEQIL